MRDILTKSLLLRGFIQREFLDQRPAFYRDVAAWIADGSLRYREDIVDGLDSAPEAFIGLLDGRNFGKLIVRVAARSEEPKSALQSLMLISCAVFWLNKKTI